MAAKRIYPITVEELREAFIYEPDTGNFYFRSTKKKGYDLSRPAGTVGGSYGYLRLTLNKRQHMAHRVAWALYYGEIPDGHIDHIDQDKLNNRIGNLRLATIQQNSFNQRGWGAIPAKGVTKPKGSKRFQAQIKANGSVLKLCYFDTIDEAAHAYNKAAIEVHGEFAVLNPIGTDKS